MTAFSKRRFAFVLARDFTLSPLSLFVDTLRLAGDEGDRSRRVAFDWHILGDRGLPQTSSSGIQVLPTSDFGDPRHYDDVVLVGGLLGSRSGLSPPAEQFLLQAAKARVPLTALCTGSFLLAKYGLLNGYKASISWFHVKEFRSTYPEVEASADKLFVVDRDRATCAGGTGAADLAANLVKGMIGTEAADKAAKILIMERIRDGRDVQPIGELFPMAQSRIIRATLLHMGSNIEVPLFIPDIARRVGLTRRQMERIFAAELGTSPRLAYMKIRLHYADHLLKESDLRISEVALKCGFENAGHFSRAYRNCTGRTPTLSRKSGSTNTGGRRL